MSKPEVPCLYSFVTHVRDDLSRGGLSRAWQNLPNHIRGQRSMIEKNNIAAWEIPLPNFIAHVLKTVGVHVSKNINFPHYILETAPVLAALALYTIASDTLPIPQPESFMLLGFSGSNSHSSDNESNNHPQAREITPVDDLPDEYY